MKPKIIKKLICAALSILIAIAATGCARFVPNDNPPLRIPVADDRIDG